jgi:tRNA uridine 5-carboxymethylaminomethyl modification enzyme
MLTARAEYRLALRADNAETRLSPLAETLGCLSDARRAHIDRHRKERHRIETELAALLTADQVVTRGGRVARDGARRTIVEWMRFPDVTADRLIDDLERFDPRVLAEVVEDARYAPYLQRQAQDVADRSRAAATALPSDLGYDGIAGLSNEMVERLSAARPATLEAAARVRGISPAALSAILLHVKRRAA